MPTIYALDVSKTITDLLLTLPYHAEKRTILIVARSHPVKKDQGKNLTIQEYHTLKKLIPYKDQKKVIN